VAVSSSDGRSAVIFDLWGTLVPFNPGLWAQCEARIIGALGADAQRFTPAWHADYPARVVGALEDSFRRVCSAVGLRADRAAITGAVEIRCEAHAQMFRPRADAAATLRELRESGYRIALITNCTSEVPGLWRSSTLSELVDETVFSCDAGLRKPDPSIYHLAATVLGVDPSQCLYVGDGADNELVGAEAVGMRAVQLDAPDTDRPESWNGESIRALAEIPSLLEAG
jgi:putative hydrolase of the HAD superfamily